MLNLVPVNPSQTAAAPGSWQPKLMYAPPLPATAAERAAEELKAQQAAMLTNDARMERGMPSNRGREGKNRPRKTVDYFAGLDRWRLLRTMRTCIGEVHQMRPNPNYVIEMLPPTAYPENYSTSVCGRYVHTSTNKVRCPVNLVRFTSEGRRIITGSTSGEFTLWNGLTFNFESILQAHDGPVRCGEWSNSGIWFVSGDGNGTIKYFQNNMNNLQAFQAHPESVRDVSFAPNDARFATGADDSTIKIWSFEEMREEKTLSGHGWDVKCVKWHPTKGLLVSGSKDNLVKFWDPRSAKCLTTLHGHKNTVQALAWNPNGNLVASASRDSFIKVYDIRAMKELVQLRGHKKEVCSIAWHPIHHSYLASGGSEGSICHWSIESSAPTAAPLEALDYAHDSNVWSLAFHPLGHVLASASNDHTTRFWSRNRPGVSRNMMDRFHIGKDESRRLGVKEEEDDHDEFALPGLGGGNFGGMQNSRPQMPMPMFNQPPSEGFIPGFGGAPPPGMGMDMPPGMGMMPGMGMPPQQGYGMMRRNGPLTDQREMDFGQQRRGRARGRGRGRGRGMD